MAQKPVGQALDPKIQKRCAELIGMGLSHREAAGACDISEASVARILKKPEYRKIADDVRQRHTSVTAQAAAVVQELLNAVDDHGDPAMMMRKMGAELVMKNPALLESVEPQDDDTLLPGVVLRFPWGAEDEKSRDSREGGDPEAEVAPSEDSENGSTVQEAFAEVVEALDDYDPLKQTVLGGDILRENARSTPVDPHDCAAHMAEVPGWGWECTVCFPEMREARKGNSLRAVDAPLDGSLGGSESPSVSSVAPEPDDAVAGDAGLALVGVGDVPTVDHAPVDGDTSLLLNPPVAVVRDVADELPLLDPSPLHDPNLQLSEPPVNPPRTVISDEGIEPITLATADNPPVDATPETGNPPVALPEPESAPLFTESDLWGSDA